MKNVLLIVVAVALFGYLGWHWFAPKPAPPPPPQVQRTPAKPATARVPPAKGPGTQSAKPVPMRAVVTRQPRLAPEGTYFLLQRVSLKIESGVVGFAPGTKLALVESNHSMSTVTDGTYRFEVPFSLLTNDLDVAEGAAKSDWAQQAQIAQAIGQNVRAYQQQQRDDIAAEEKERAEKNKGQKTSPRRSPTPSRPR